MRYGGERGGKTAFLTAVQEISHERDVFKAQRDKLFVMLVSVGVRRGILERVLEDTEKELARGKS